MESQNSTFTLIHEHMTRVRPIERQYVKKGRVVTWASDFIFLDLPCGVLPRSGGEPCPIWDRLTEEHVRFGIALAASTLADCGWLLVMASFAGTCNVNVYVMFIVLTSAHPLHGSKLYYVCRGFYWMGGEIHPCFRSRYTSPSGGRA